MGKLLLLFIVIIMSFAHAILWFEPESIASVYVTTLSGLLNQLTIITAYILFYVSGVLRYPFFRTILQLLGWVLPSYMMYALLSPSNIGLPPIQPLDIFFIIELSIISFILTNELKVKKYNIYFNKDRYQEKFIIKTRFPKASKAS